jgi:uncharacterized membrane protein YjgN (DUF898 family)
VSRVVRRGSTAPDSEPEPPAAPKSEAPTGSIGLRYAADGFELLGIGIANALLSALTFGIYYAWGRARELRYVIGAMRADGDPFTFHGKGGELFRGLLRAVVFFFLPLVALVFFGSLVGGPGDAWLFQLLFYVLVLLFIPFATIGSLRYRLSRTSWRGIRFGFDGNSREFAAGWLPRAVLTFLTLGLAYPWLACWRRRYVMSRARFGTEPFAFEAEADPLFRKFLPAWLLTIPTLGLSWTWYYGEQQAYFWSRTRLGPARFHCGLTGGEWLWASFLGGIMAAITFGIATPWIYVRLHRLFLTSLSLEGMLDFEAIRQRTQDASGLGEGVGDLLDLDPGLEIG